MFSFFFEGALKVQNAESAFFFYAPWGCFTSFRGTAVAPLVFSPAGGRRVLPLDLLLACQPNQELRGGGVGFDKETSLNCGKKLYLNRAFLKKNRKRPSAQQREWEKTAPSRKKRR